MTTPPDYKQYTLDELQDVLANIDRGTFPERYNIALNELQLRFPNAEAPIEGTYRAVQIEHNAEVTNKWEFPKTIYPKLKWGHRSYISLVFLTLICIGLYTFLNLSFLESISFSIAFLILFAYILIAIRHKSYIQFIDSIGIPVDTMNFLAEPSIRSLVPFQNYNHICSVRVDNDKLLFGKPKHYRSISLSIIESFEFKIYYGNIVARINFIDGSTFNEETLFVPWSNDIESAIDLYFNDMEETCLEA